MAVVEMVVSAMFKEVLDKLVSEGVKQFAKLINKGKKSKNKIKIEEWKDELEMIEAVLIDAERKQCDEQHGAAIRLWLENLQDLAFDLEDLLDDFALEALKMNQGNNDDFDVHHFKKNGRGFLPTSFHNMVGSVLACGCSATGQTGYSGPDFSSRIDEISNALSKIISQAPTLSLLSNLRLPTYAVEEQQRKMPETSSLIKETHVYGRDLRQKDIICRLLEDKPSYENYVVIPIVGMGGIGKTTLAQYVYNDEQVKAHFAVKAWVCVSDVFDVKRITKDIINSATHGNFDCSNLNQAQEKLQQVLKHNKFLIVLDDVWSENYEYWVQLRTPFLGAARGSRVIVTSRNDKTAKKMTKNHSTIIHLEGLSDGDCWLLFQQHANIDDFEIKDDIVRKCKGLPLAAKTLGGLIKCTTEKSKRREILESNVWGEEYEECGVLLVLRVSYHYLPSFLKRVFAYCSVFPKDYEIEEMEIIQLWMAQGFLPDNKDRRMEDIGQNYFNDLVSRSLFEKSPSKQGMFIMHDLIHDVAQFAAGNLCNVMDGADRQMDYFRRTRHLFITKHVQTLGNQIMASQLRTFLCKYGLKIDDSDFFKKFRYIRTLSLCSYEIEALPECIGDLKNLRYLRLKFRRIKELPLSIKDLWNLQTLCLKGCYKLEKVPCIESLGKLCHLYLGNTSLKEMPLGIGKLTNLQTLDKFVLAGGGGSKLRELGKLNQLRGRLIIKSRLENVTEVEDADEAQLCKKEHLDGLKLKLKAPWKPCTDDEVDDKTRDVVEKLRPHTSIKECELNGYTGWTFPSWLGDSSFINMVDIQLIMCENCECLPPLGQLPSLKSLLIRDVNFIDEVGLEFYGNCSTPFPSLKTLEFSWMENWEKWVHPLVDNNKAFLNLFKLTIKHCPSLQGDLPPHLPSLRRLCIYGVQQLQSLELKNSSSSTSHLEEVIVGECKSMVFIGQIPLTLKSLRIKNCEKLGYVEFDEQSTNLSCGSAYEKGLRSEESIGVSSKAALELLLLTELEIERCPSLISLQQSLLLPALQNLQLKDCENMERLPAHLHNFTSLQELRIEKVNIKQAVTEWELQLLASLERLILENVGSSADSVECFMCPHLSLPASLLKLEIRGFQNLRILSNGNTLPNLTFLSVSDCPRLESLVSNLTSLTYLSIENCPVLHKFPEGGLPTNLKDLLIRGTDVDKPIKEWGLHLLTSLQLLRLENVGSCVDTLESISYLDFPSSLRSLTIRSFQNLKTICCSALPRLRLMYIIYCPKLESLGDNGLPPHISFVDIEECDMIEQHLTSDPNGRIKTKNGKFSMPLSGSQPSSAETTC